MEENNINKFLQVVTKIPDSLIKNQLGASLSNQAAKKKNAFRWQKSKLSSWETTSCSMKKTRRVHLGCVSYKQRKGSKEGDKKVSSVVISSICFDGGKKKNWREVSICFLYIVSIQIGWKSHIRMEWNSNLSLKKFKLFFIYVFNFFVIDKWSFNFFFLPL